MLQQTSIAAGRSFNASGDKIIHHASILAALELFGDATSHQIADRCNLSYMQVVRRMNELVDDNKVCDSGRLGKSPSGRACIVWSKVKTV